MRLLARLAAGLILVILVYEAVGGLMLAVSGPLPMRGTMVDIGERKLHLVCEGPKAAKPTVLFEAGAFGFSADWGVVQERATALGLRTCSYDRAGLGLSDPGPEPRDSAAIVSDLEKLLAAAHEDGPYILVGHSMAGLHLRLFATRNPAKVAGLVLVDATTPEAMDDPRVHKFVGAFVTASNLAALGARAGLYKPLASTWLGDKIGLTPVASAEKRRAFASPRHNRWAAAEVRQWPASAAEAKAGGPLDPKWPVAVIVADRKGAGANDSRAIPARQAVRGHFEAVPGAIHQTLLGMTYADAVVRGISFVLEASRSHG
jgi:pimeloyl-ACP methyl ester carboxylesterase